MEPILALLGILILVFAIGFVVRKLGGGGADPENPVGTDVRRHGETGTERPDAPEIPPYPAGSRPGGPGAEAMNPAEAGNPAAGPDGADESYGTEDAAKPSDAARKPLGDE